VRLGLGLRLPLRLGLVMWVPWLQLLVLLRLLLRGVLLLCAELHTEVRVWGQGGLSKIAE
jgi:hypothetical protein